MTIEQIEADVEKALTVHHPDYKPRDSSQLPMYLHFPEVIPSRLCHSCYPLFQQNIVWQSPMQTNVLPNSLMHTSCSRTCNKHDCTRHWAYLKFPREKAEVSPPLNHNSSDIPLVPQHSESILKYCQLQGPGNIGGLAWGWWLRLHSPGETKRWSSPSWTVACKENVPSFPKEGTGRQR